MQTGLSSPKNELSKREDGSVGTIQPKVEFNFDKIDNEDQGSVNIQKDEKPS